VRRCACDWLTLDAKRPAERAVGWVCKPESLWCKQACMLVTRQLGLRTRGGASFDRAVCTASCALCVQYSTAGFPAVVGLALWAEGIVGTCALS
jgi:hypothetical protein